MNIANDFKCQGVKVSDNGFHEEICNGVVHDKNDIFCDEHKNQRNETAVCVCVIKKYLSECEDACGKENKKKVCKKMFVFLIQNAKFVWKHSRFRDMVITKLNEFIIEEQWSEAQYYKEKLLIEICKIDKEEREK